MTPKKRKKTNIQKILNRPVQSNEQHSISPKKEGFLGWMSYMGWGLSIWLVPFWVSKLLDFYGKADVVYLLTFRGEVVWDGLYFLSWGLLILPIIIFYKSSYRLLCETVKGLFLFIGYEFIFLNFWALLSQWLDRNNDFWHLVLSIIVYFFMLFCCVFVECFRNKLSIAKKISCFMISFIGVLRTLFLFDWENFDKYLYLCVSLFFELVLPTLLLIGYLYYFYKKYKDGYRYVWLKVLLFPLFLFIPMGYEEEIIIKPEIVMGDPLY